MRFREAVAIAFGFPRCSLQLLTRTQYGAGFSHLPAPSKQLWRDLGGRPRLLMPTTHSGAPFLPLLSWEKQNFLLEFWEKLWKACLRQRRAAGSPRARGGGLRGELRSQCAQGATAWRPGPPRDSLGARRRCLSESCRSGLPVSEPLSSH